MRIPALAMLAVAAAVTAAPAAAQSYDPRFPVCLQTYQFGARVNECNFDTVAQCQATAQGRGGQCLENPFFAGPRDSDGPRFPRPGLAY
jgi:hypothetical protein